MSLWCLDGVWKVSDRCLEVGWKVSSLCPTQLGMNFYLELEFDSGVDPTCYLNKHFGSTAMSEKEF